MWTRSNSPLAYLSAFITHRHTIRNYRSDVKLGAKELTWLVIKETVNKARRREYFPAYHTWRSAARERRATWTQALRAEDVDLLGCGEFFSDGGEVHGPLDDLPVAGDALLIDWRQEGPSVLLGLQLTQQHPAAKNHDHGESSTMKTCHQGVSVISHCEPLQNGHATKIVTRW